MKIIFIAILSFLFSWVLTWGIRVYSLRKAILDIPNERSSHAVPTPRGGGLAIASTFFLGLIALLLFHMIPWNLFIALLGGGLLIAAVGYWDDLFSLSVKIRFGLHFLAAFWALYFLGGFTDIQLGSWHWHSGFLGTILAAFGVVWLINLYNFMDGIDGIAGSEAIYVSGVAGITLLFLGASGIAAICFILLAAVMGFLFWNWSPAKIFLGDVGSGLLGFIFAVLAITSANSHAITVLLWLTLLAVFVFDATFTLLRRMWLKERWYGAHRQHAYQRLVQLGFTHHFVTITMSVVNIIVITPVFYCMLYQPQYAVYLFFLLGLSFWLGWFVLVRRSNHLIAPSY